ncbi:MAG: ATP-binding cassette domain-containing protein [Deltaproteobacteria bacterium]|nr:ATP-binding cassette domain-containing protein [Deltaproteobacteria bacterium]MBI3296387.1 ATP-binding cassette domain-containing protein [Deltaproteobacteria bacterium]
MILKAENLFFDYKTEHQTVRVLNNVSFTVNRGDFVAIEGPSGSGKSTLFYLLGCLLKPTSGRIFLNDLDVTQLGEDELSAIRNRTIGFVFQQFYLLARATVTENIVLPASYPCERKRVTEEQRARAQELARTVGLEHRIDNHPNQLSGGEQQRVAVARALMNDADLILADEPTGNLDTKNAENIMGLLEELNRRGKTIILITHSPEIAARCRTRLKIRDGVLEVTTSSRPVADTQGAERAAPLPLSWPRLIRGVLPVALENLNRNRRRAFLTLIGVTVGIAAVLAMITVSQFIKDRIIESYKDLGINRVVVRGHHNWHAKAVDLTGPPFMSFDNEMDVKTIPRIFPQVELISPVLTDWGSTITYGGQSSDNDVAVFGVEAPYLTIVNRELESGRPITPYHIDQGSPVCVIGTDIVRRLFSDRSPLGEILFVASDKDPYPCQVIGVMKAMSSNNDWRKPNSELLLPMTYFQAKHDYWRNRITTVSMQLRAGSDLERTGKGIRKFFNQKYGASGEFHVNNDAILFAQMRKFLGLFTIMLSCIALITLGVGGMGINNMMLVSLSERLKEIGLRKALGATHRSIRIQFLLESVFLCAIAGLLGILIGFALYQSIIWLAAQFITKLTFAWVFDPLAFSVAVVSILVVGLASGMIPALKAERLQVIEALRNE